MKKHRTLRLILLTCLPILALSACQKEPKKVVLEAAQGLNADSMHTVTPAPAQPPTAEQANMGVIVPLVAELGAGQSYTVVFDDVRIRETPSLNGTIITTAQTGDKMKVFSEMDNASEGTDAVVLRGVRYTAHWYKIITPGGKEGWIYGAAIGRYQTATRV